MTTVKYEIETLGAKGDWYDSYYGGETLKHAHQLKRELAAFLEDEAGYRVNKYVPRLRIVRVTTVTTEKREVVS